MKVLAAPSQLEELSRDAGIIRLIPRVGYVAESEGDVELAVKEAAEKGLSLTPRGSGTSIPSQSIGTGIVLLQDRRGITINEAGTVTCEPALVKAELNKQLEARGLWMPVDPSSFTMCSVGGIVSNNSSGVRTPKYGSTVDHVEALRVVIPEDGLRVLTPMPVEEALSADPKTKKVASLLLENQKAILDERPRVSKNSSGYRLEKAIHDGVFDIPKLFVGSEGTLGVVTEITFRVSPKPPSRVLFVVESLLDELDRTVAAFREHSPTAVELLDKSVFRKMGKGDRIARYSRRDGDYLVFSEFDGTEEEVSRKMEEVAGSKVAGYDPIVLTSQADIAHAWEVRNETLTLGLEVRSGSKILVPGVEDLVVPHERLADLVKLLLTQFEARGLTYISYGHAGDANLHARPLLDPNSPPERRILEEMMEECFESVWKMGASITGEHGDGMLRAPYVERQYPKTFSIMKEIRRTYDPRGVLNPGVKIV